MDKQWVLFRQAEGSALREVMLSTLTLPGRNQRELLVKINFFSWKNVKPGNQSGTKSIIDLFVDKSIF